MLRWIQQLCGGQVSTNALIDLGLFVMCLALHLDISALRRRVENLERKR